MNLGDGLLFEIENGKPKLILLSHGVEKNAAKPSFRPRAATILSSRQPSCVEEVQREEQSGRQQQGRLGETKSKAGGAAASFTSTFNTNRGRSSTLTSSKTHEQHKESKVSSKVKSDKHSAAVGSLRANGKTVQPPSRGMRASGKARLKDTPKDSVVCLTNEKLQQILRTVQTSSTGLPEDYRTQSSDGNQTDSAMNGGGGGGGGMEEDRGGGTDTAGKPQDKDDRLSGCPFSWLEERQSDSRAAVDAKKAQWRRELDEQVALKQQQQHSAPGRLQAEEDTASVFSIQSSVSYRDQPSAIRSSLRFGEVSPMEEVLIVERKEEQRRRWLEELDRQRQETSERRRQEKLLQSQTEDHELWAAHFDSLQRRPLVQTAALPALPPALSNGSERGDLEPSSSLSLVWEATSSCGAESVGGASIDTTRYPTRTSYLRTMTALLDPAQIEERERRRLKQLEQQQAIEAQVEERRQQREQEEARRRKEEEEEERRVALEREMLERLYELDTLRERQKSNQRAEQPKKDQDGGGHQETLEPGVTKQHESLEEDVNSSTSPYKDTAVQTEAAPSLRVQTPDVSAQYQPPPPPPPPRSAAPPPNSRSRAVRTGKENVCLPGGGGGGGDGDPYEAFARTDRSGRDKKRPEWNTQRPSRRFVPASERYPASLQRNRQESRQRRQAELLALQERTRLSRTDPPPPPPPPPQHQNPHPTQTTTCPTRKVESFSRGRSINTERGRSPPIPAVGGQSQRAPPSSTPPPPPPPPPPVLEFIPYVRTDEVFNLDPLEPADTPPPHTHTEARQSSAPPPAPSHRLLRPERPRNAHTHRQQEILRGLAQLRQGLLQKQRELETDLNPLLKRHDHEHRLPSATHRK